MEQLILISLAVWRISSLLARERGPFDIFLNLRIKLGVKRIGDRETGTSNLSDGILCVWCNTLWVAPFAALLITTDPLYWFINTLAISTIAIIVDSVVIN